MSWLDPVLRALDERAEPCEVFFRDDDAGRDDVRLEALLDRFAAWGVGVDLAVIPALVGPSLARALAERVADGGVRLHQHGLAHVNHEAAGRKHEFGPSRSLAQQLADVAEGRRILLDRFGAAALDPVFTPPWNRCTVDTGVAVLRHGLWVLSRDHTAVPLGLPGLVEVPVTVDWFGHTRGVSWTPTDLAVRIADRVRGVGRIGVMLHHALVEADDLARLDALLALCVGHPAVRPTPLCQPAGSLSTSLPGAAT